MAEQDFYLKFGSNADAFAEDVRKEITGAREELSLLSQAIKEVNQASKGSPTAKLVSGIRADIKSAMGDVAKTIGDELRSALRSELKSLNLGDITINADVTGGQGGKRKKVSSTEVTDADMDVADGMRQIKKLGDSAEKGAKSAEQQINDALEQMSKLMPRGRFKKVMEETAELEGNMRVAMRMAKTVMGAFDKELIDLNKKLKAARGRRDAALAADDTRAYSKASKEVSRLEGAREHVNLTRKPIAESLEDGSADAGKLFNQAILQIEKLDAAIEAQIREVMAAASESARKAKEQRKEPSGRVETAPPESGDFSDRLVAVGNIMAAAANDLKEATAAFKTHVDAFKNAAQNIRVEGVVSTGPRPGGKSKKMKMVEGEDASLEKAAEDFLEESESGEGTKRARKKTKDAAEENAKTLTDLDSTDRQSAELAKEERQAREEVVNSLKAAARRAREPEGFDREKLAEARRDAGPAARNVGRELPVQMASLSTAGLFRTQEQEGSQQQRQLARVLELIAKRQSASGSAGVTERLGLVEALRSRETDAGKTITLKQDEAAELETLVNQMSEGETLRLRAILRTLESAKALREKAKQVAEGISTEYSISQAQVKTGAQVLPRGTRGALLGQEDVFDRRPDESEADRLKRVQGAIGLLTEHREAERQAVVDLIQQTITSAASLDEFEQALEVLPDSLKRTARELLQVFDESKEAQPLDVDTTTEQGRKELVAQTASIRRSAERNLAAERERERERVASQLSTLSEPAAIRGQTSLLQFGQERTRDLDTLLEKGLGRRQALQERLDQAQVAGESDEVQAALRDKISELTRVLERRRLQIEGGVDDQGREFAGDADVSRRFFVGDRVRQSRGFDVESGKFRSFEGAALSPDARERLRAEATRKTGSKDAGRDIAGSLVDIYEGAFGQLQNAIAKSFQRRGAENVLSEGEAPDRLAAARERGDEVGVAKYEAEIAQAEAILERIPKGIEDMVRRLERFLTTPGIAEGELARDEPRVRDIFEGRSFAEVVRGAAPRTDESPEIRGLTRESVEFDARRQAYRSFAAREGVAGVDAGSSLDEIKGALSEEQLQQALAESREAARKAVADFDRMEIAIKDADDRSTEFTSALRRMTNAFDVASRGAAGIDLGRVRGALEEAGLLGDRGPRPFTGQLGNKELDLDIRPLLQGGVQDSIEKFLIDTESVAREASEGRRERERALTGERGVHVDEPLTQLEDERRELKALRDRLREGGSVESGDVPILQRLTERLRRADQPRGKDRTERFGEIASMADRFGIDRSLLSDEQGRPVETGEQFLELAKRLATNAQALEENEQATERNTEAVRAPEPEAVAAQRSRLAGMDIESRADLAAVAGGTRFGALGDEGLTRLGELGISVKNRKASSIDDVFAQATALKDATPETADVTQSAISSLRNILLGLIGPSEASRFKDDPKVITDKLLTAASAAQENILKAAGRPESDVSETLGLRTEQNVNERLINVLTRLSGTIEALAACCKNMQGALGQQAGRPTDLSAGAVARARGSSAANELIGPNVQGEIVELLRRAGIAGTEGRDADRRRLLGAAALEARGSEVSLGDNEVIGAVQALAKSLPASQAGQESGLTNQDIQSIKGRLLQFATIVEQGGKAAGEAFKNNNIELAAKLLQENTRDVATTLQTLRNVFDVSEDSLKSLRPELENLENTLKTLDEAQRATDERDKVDRAPTQEEINRGQLQAATASAFAGREVDLSDQSDEAARATAEDALKKLNNQRADESQLIQKMQAFYPNLTEETQKYIRSLARTKNEAAEAALKNEAYAQSFASALPQEMQGPFMRSVGAGVENAEVSPGQLTDAIVQNTGQARTKTLEGTMSRLIQGVDIGPSGRKLADDLYHSMQSRMSTYRTPFQQFMQRLTGGAGLVDSTLRTAGNYVSRFLGGSIVFGAVNQLQELGRQALEAEQTFIRVDAALEATGRSSDGLRNKLQDLSVETNVSIADTTEVMAQLVGVFETVEEALEATRVVNQLELISQGALNAREGFKSISAVSSTFQDDLMKPIEEGGKGLTNSGAITYVADLTVRLQDLTGVNVEDTIEGLGRLGETARALDIEMELLATSLALTAKATGLNGTEISEQIGRILSQFQSADAQNLLITLGITDQATIQAGDFGQVLEDLFASYTQLNQGQRRSIANILGGSRQFATTNALLERGAEALDVYDQSLNNAGAAAERAEDVLGTLRGQIGQVSKQVQAFVQSLVELGVLNVFGVLLKTVSLVLKPVNQFLQYMVSLSEMSPLANMLFQIGLTIAGFAVMKEMIQGVIAEYQHLAVQQASQAAAGAPTTVMGTLIGGAARRKERLAERVSMVDRLRDAHRTRTFGTRAATSRLGTKLPGALGANLGVGIDRAVTTTNKSLGKLRTSIMGLGPVALMGAAAIVLAISAAEKALDDVDFADQFPDPDTEGRQEGETEAEAEARQERDARQQYAADLAETGESGVIGDLGDTGVLEEFVDQMLNLWQTTKFAITGLDELGAVLNTLWQAPLDYILTLGGALDWGPLDWLFDATGSRDILGDALAGFVNEDGRAKLDELGAGVAGINAPGQTDEERLEKARELQAQLDEEAREIVESQSTKQQQATAAKELEVLEGAIDKQIAALDASVNGIGGTIDYTRDQLAAAIEAFEFAGDFTPSEFANFRQDIENLLGERLTEESKALLNEMGTATDGSSRAAAQGQFLDTLVREARRDLRIVTDENDGGDQDAIDDARERLDEVIKMRVEHDRELLASLIDLPLKYSDLAARTGDYARAEALISQSLAEIRSQMTEVATNTEEHAALVGQEMDALRTMAELSIQEQVDALSLDKVSSRDPMVDTGNDLRQVQLQLQAALDNPGAYSPEEIIGFMQEIADLQDQIADEQERIAQAYDDYLASNANNDLARSAIEYKGALRRYRRALETDAGAAAITEAATEVNEAARAQREAVESLREAQTQTRIARIPVADTLRAALAELAETYKRQAFTIQEFGRNSVEYESLLQEIVQAERAAEEAAREVSDATLDFAISLANAAGLDVRSSRLSLEAAQTALRRAIADSGGEDTAAVRNQAAAVVDAQAQLRDVILGEALETVDFMLNMEEITERQAIQVLQQILDTADLTEDQRRDLMSRIKGLKDAINQGVSDQFNLGDIRIPTPFEVRRALKVEEITQGLQDSVDAVTELDPPTLPADNIAPAPAGLLEDILGPELASEVMGLGASGGSISQEIRNLGEGLSGDLLPPLSQIPQIIDAQLLTRDQIVARSDMQIQTLVANNEALNASVNQIGPTIAVPLAAIHEAEIAALELEASSNIMLEDANNYLADIKSLTMNMRDMMSENMMSEKGMDAWGQRYQAQADAGYRPPSKDDTYNAATEYTQTIINNFAGAGAQEVREELRKQVGPVVINRESTYTTAGRRVR